MTVGNTAQLFLTILSNLIKLQAFYLYFLNYSSSFLFVLSSLLKDPDQALKILI